MSKETKVKKKGKVAELQHAVICLAIIGIVALIAMCRWPERETAYASEIDGPGSLSILGERVRAAALDAKDAAGKFIKEKEKEAEEKKAKEAAAHADEQPAAEVELTIEERILTAASAAGIDENMAVAISRLETGHFSSAACVFGNNVGGLSDNEVPRSYASIEEGVAAYIGCLSAYYSKGLTTPELIGPYWCPGNPEWPAKVRSLM